MLKKMLHLLYRNKHFVAFYLIFGVTTAGIYFLLFTICYKYLNLNYNLAISLAYFVAVIVHFTASRRVTFKAHGHALHAQLFKYLIMLGINYIITLIAMYVVMSLTQWAYLGMVCSIGITTITGFFMAKFWVFHHKR